MPAAVPRSLFRSRRGRIGIALVLLTLAAAALFAARSVPSSRIPTYDADVAPIFAKHCIGCHRAEGPAPLMLDDPEGARALAPRIRRAVAERRMPPWSADNTGYCGTWKQARWLSPSEIGAILAWADNGAPARGGRRAQQVPQAPAASLPFRPTTSLAIGAAYRPGLGADAHRCFVLDPELKTDRLLSALRIVSPDPRGVVQATLFALDSEIADVAAARLDSLDPRPGYPCFGTTRTPDARLLASWTAGEAVLRLTDEGGVPLFAQRKLVLQIHYNIQLTGSGYSTTTAVDLELQDRGPVASVLRIAAAGTVPPRKRDARVVARQAIERRARLVGVSPRMHERGRMLQLSVERAGGRRVCLATFDHWDYRNQETVRPVEPPALEAGDTLEIACLFNTLDVTKPLPLGGPEGAQGEEEECASALLVVDG